MDGRSWLLHHTIIKELGLHRSPTLATSGVAPAPARVNRHTSLTESPPTEVCRRVFTRTVSCSFMLPVTCSGNTHGAARSPRNIHARTLPACDEGKRPGEVLLLMIELYEAQPEGVSFDRLAALNRST